MGVYCYSFRSKTVPLYLADGSKVRANLYSYAYRLTSYWPGERGHKSYKFMTDNTERNAEASFAKPRSGYVILGDTEKGLDGLIGDPVYTDVTSALWFDTDRFPGRILGWVAKQGNRFVISDRTEWTHGQIGLAEGWKPFRSRSVMVDGKATREEEILG